MNREKFEFTFGIGDDCFIGSVPINAVRDAFYIRVAYYHIGIASSLGEALGEAHAAVWELAWI